MSETILIPLVRDGEQHIECEHGVTLGLVDGCPECYRMTEIITESIVFWDSSRRNLMDAKPKRKAKIQEQEELDLKNSG